MERFNGQCISRCGECVHCRPTYLEGAWSYVCCRKYSKDFTFSLVNYDTIDTQCPLKKCDVIEIDKEADAINIDIDKGTIAKIIVVYKDDKEGV